MHHLSEINAIQLTWLATYVCAEKQLPRSVASGIFTKIHSKKMKNWSIIEVIPYNFNHKSPGKERTALR